MVTRSAAVARVWIAIAALAIFVAACGSQPTPTPAVVPSPAPSTSESTASLPSTPATQAEPSGPSSADVQAAAQIIAAANAADPGSLDAVGGKLLFTQPGAEAALETLNNGVSGDALWAALWVYGSAGSDPAPVARYMSDSDPSIRAMAAADDVQLGDASGFAVLAPLLSVTEGMRASEPPKSISVFTEGVLETVIDPASAPNPDNDAGAWASWLASNASALTFDAKNGVWTKQ